MATTTTYLIAIQGLSRADLLDALGEWEVTEIEQVVQEPKPVFIVAIQTDHSDPTTLLKAVRKAMPSPTRVERVLSNERGERLIPTGTIQVRFVDEPSDELLESFSASNGLRVLARNRFQAKQVAFAVSDESAADIDADVSRVSACEGVRRAWPEVLSTYRRSEKPVR